MRLLSLACIAALFILPVSVHAETFESWLVNYKQRAVQSGIPLAQVEHAFRGVTYNERVIELDRKQPDGQMTLQEYVERTVRQDRIDKGRVLLNKNSAALREIERRYGVSPSIIVALWGKESEYGGYTGTSNTISSLATLAYEGRRRDFFEKELQHAIILLNRLGWSAQDMKGSWAGAVGQCQFMPSNYLKFAVDGNNNGRVDLWHELDDIFASMGNLLRHEGWRAGQEWGQRVKLPAGFDNSLIGRDKEERDLRFWEQRGVRFDHPVSPSVQNAIRIYQPDGVQGPSYALYPNFDVLMRWNRSGYFATAVGRLSDQLSQR